jgi:dimethylsulfone monooxygenase
MSIAGVSQLQHRKSVTAEVLRGPFDPGGQPSLERDHPLHLSLFAWNVRSGLSATKAVLSDPKRHRDFWEWPSARELLQATERAGMDSQLQYGMWSGYGGPSDWNGASLDFATAAAASAAVTERLGLFTTVHVGYDFHPLLIAKITAATDHVSGGRLGVNLVAAFDLSDYAQFGFGKQRAEEAVQERVGRTPEERYAMADEFTTLLKYLWTSEDPVDFEGEYFQAYGAQVNPKPTSSPRPILMSAASSDLGIQYAAKQCDAIFISAREKTKAGYAEMADRIRSAAAEHGRRVRICAMCYVIMEDTDEKAAETVEWLEDEVDVEALTNQFWRTQSVYHRDHKVSDDPYLGKGEGWFRSHGLGMGGYQLFGSYETVADKLKDLHDAGVEHVALCFWDPHRGVDQVGRNLIPLLRERGLRRD